MKTKKSKRANLENYRTIFLQIGLILTLSAILAAFQWNSVVKTETLTNNYKNWIDIEDLPPVTRPESEKKEVKPPVPIEKLIIRKNNVDIVDEPIFESTETDWKEKVDIPIYNDRKEDGEGEPFLSAEFMPTFQGHDGNYFRKYVAENVKFPVGAVENGISGTVYASFVINKDGSVTDVKILRGVHPVIDNAVLDCIKNSPRWEPGINNGKYVRVRYSIAVAFKLQ